MTGMNRSGGTISAPQRQRVRASEPTHRLSVSDTVGMYSRKNSSRVNPTRMSSAIMDATKRQMLWIKRHSNRIGPIVEERSRCGQVRECLVEESLSIRKREPLGLAKKLVPCRSVERGTQGGLVVFGESHRAGVELGDQL